MDELRTSASSFRATLNIDRTHSPSLSGEFSDDSLGSPRAQMRRGSAESLVLGPNAPLNSLLVDAMKVGNLRAVETLTRRGARDPEVTKIMREAVQLPEEEQVGMIRDVCKAYEKILTIIDAPSRADGVGDQIVPDNRCCATYD